jgi:hypothetical protein
MWEFTARTPSYNGAGKQSTESIRLVAPRYYQRQGRNVTAADYKAYLESEYSSMMESINVWGGEDHDPAYYGKVFVCMNPKPGNSVTTQLKKTILNKLAAFNVVTVKPVIIDPDIILVDLTVNLEWNRINSPKSAGDVKAGAEDVINKYFAGIDTLQGEISMSQIISALNSVDDYITAMQIEQTFVKEFVPFYNQKYTYTFQFQNQLRPGTASFSPFIAIGDGLQAWYMSIKDNGEGRLDAFLNDMIYDYGVGEVDYDSGIVSLINYTFPASATGIDHICSARPLNNNNKLKREKMFKLRRASVTLNDITARDGLDVSV